MQCSTASAEVKGFEGLPVQGGGLDGASPRVAADTVVCGVGREGMEGMT